MKSARMRPESEKTRRLQLTILSGERDYFEMGVKEYDARIDTSQYL